MKVTDETPVLVEDPAPLPLSTTTNPQWTGLESNPASVANGR